MALMILIIKKYEKVSVYRVQLILLNGGVPKSFLNPIKSKSM